MRFQVPQFIEIEDKIFGPLTFKQFVYLAGGVGFAVLLFLLLPKFLAFIIAAPVLAFAGALAFYKVNNKPFINVVEAFFKYTLTTKLYLWKKERAKPEGQQENDEKKTHKEVYVPKLSESKLKELSWSLDIRENPNKNPNETGNDV